MRIVYSLILIMMITALDSVAQTDVTWTTLPQLPGDKGWAGMYAGVSHEALLAMGGANFPEKYPWEGGKKKWYDDIYVLEKDKKWIKANDKLSLPGGYGVSVSYQNQVIIVGGSNESGHLNEVRAVEWIGNRIRESKLPALPFPLANMAGMLFQDVIVVFGGSNSPTEPGLKKCLGLDMLNITAGWFELDSWPGPERVFPVCSVYKNQGYMFGGETVALNSKGEKFRSILLDGYRLSLEKQSDTWRASWEKLAPMPRGMSAGGTLLPLLRNDRFLLWGGVDAVTAQFKTPAKHPGIIKSTLFYFPETDSWEYIGEQTEIPSRVTLPVVFWNNQWVYISGEVKPGIRTTSVISVK